MATVRLGLVMHGVTGRMGYNQHLVRSILAIRDAGGLALASGDRLMPDPILVGRDRARVEAIARRHGIERWGDDLDAALASFGDAPVGVAAHSSGATVALGAVEALIAAGLAGPLRATVAHRRPAVAS